MEHIKPLRLSKVKTFARELYENIFRTKHSMVVDCLFLASTAAIVLEVLGLLTNPAPVGDDALVHIKKVVDLAGNFLHFQWDPRSFNGYSPSTGFAWASYGPPALFVSAGLDPSSVFHGAFVAYFLLLGPSVYYFARTVGAQRSVALAVSVLAWSAGGYWGSTTGYWSYVGGGAYSRVFTLPLLFITLALTYRYFMLQNAGQPSQRMYWLLIVAWIFTLLGDIYTAAVPLLVAIPFTLLSAGRKSTRLGLLRLGAILLPVLALTAWFWIPLVAHAIAVGSPPSDLTVSASSQVFWLGPIFSVIAVIARKKISRAPLRPEHAAILFSLNLVSAYFLIMGAITPLWPYIPRIWAAYDSFNILSFLFPLTLACLFAWLKPLHKKILVRYLAVALIIFVVVDASVSINLFRPPNLTPLDNALAQAFQGNFVPSDNYRVSLQGRTSTRWFPSYYPDSSQTGGRVLGLSPNPFYQSWYETEVFFKDDLSTLNAVYLEDQPPIDVRSLIAAPQNFASTTFWLDWYGVSTVVLDPAFYPVQNTAQGFSERGALFSTKTVQTGYGPLVFVNPTDPSPVLVATNASAVGFYSEQDSTNQYNAFLALLSYLGLDSRYVVPIRLSSLDDISPGVFSAIITDQNTNSTSSERIYQLEKQGTRIVVLPSGLLTQMQNQGLSGTNALIGLVSPVIPIRTQNLATPTFFPSQTVSFGPQQWTAGYSRNANGQLQISQNNLTVTVNILDTTKTAEFDLDAAPTNPPIVSDQLIAKVNVATNVQANASLVFTSNNFTSKALASNVTLSPGHWAYVQAPYVNFTQSEFSIATGFTLEITVPPGHQNATIQLGSASLYEPGHSVYTTSNGIPVSTPGFLQTSFIPSVTIILSDAKGDMVGAYPENKSAEAIVPLRAFASSHDQNFTRILSIGGDNQPVTLDLIQHPSWVPVGITWTTNQNLGAGDIQAGFHGLVWKETFTNEWNIQGKSLSGAASSLPYLFAGPGMVYVPLNGSSFANISISYQNILSGLVLPLVSSLFLLPLLIFRRRLYQLGTVRIFS